MKLFVWDVPVLIILGFVFALIHRRITDKHPDFLFHVGFITITFMWLSALFSAFGADPWFGIVNAGTAENVNGWLALFLVLSYPLWFIWGTRRALTLFGHNPRQGGFLWIMSLKDRTKPFKRTWNVDPDQLRD